MVLHNLAFVETVCEYGDKAELPELDFLSHMAAQRTSMLWLLLAALVWVASGSSFRFRYEPGRVYRFAYSSRISTQGHVRATMSATIELQPLRSHFGLVNDTGVETFMALKVLNFDLAGTDVKAMSYQSQLLAEHPMLFVLNNDPTSNSYGLIENVFKNVDDPLWSANLKKSILSTFQINLPEQGQPGSFETHENGCPVEIVTSFSDSGSHVSVSSMTQSEGECVSDFVVLSATKTHKLDLDAGLHETVSFSQVAGTAPFGDQQIEHNNTFDGSWSFLESDVSSGNEPNLDLSKWQLGTLKVEKDQSEATKTPLSDAEVNSILEAAYELEHQGVNDTDLFTKMVTTLKGREKILEALQVGLGDDSIRNVLLDVLVATGEEDIVLGLLEHTAVTGIDTQSVEESLKRIVMNIAYILPTPSLFKLVRNLCENDQSFDIRVTAHLTLGAMIHQISSRKGQLTVEAKEAFQYLNDALTGTIDNGMPFMVALHSIGNAGQAESVHSLLFLASSNDYDIEQRLAALYALRRVDGTKLNKSDRLAIFELALEAPNDDNLTWDIRRVAMQLFFDAGVSNRELDKIRHVLTGPSVLKWKSLLENVLKLVNPKAPGISKLEAVLRDIITIFDAPLFSMHDEILILGSGSTGIYAGYNVAIFNPLHPNGTSHTVVRAEGYTRIAAIRQRINIADAFFIFQGDLRNSTDTQKKPVESFLFVSVAGTVWMECIDFIGTRCAADRRRPTPTPLSDSNPLSITETCPFRKESLLFRRNLRFALFTVSVPVMYGIEIDVTVFAGAQIGFNAAASACLDPYSGIGHLQPTIGMILSGTSRIFAHVVRADATASLILANTKLNTGIDVTILGEDKKPVEACSKITLMTDLGKSLVLAKVQIRDQVKYCGSTPCGLEWGKPKVWEKSANLGGERGHWKKELQEKCLSWPNNFVQQMESSPVLVVQG